MLFPVIRVRDKGSDGKGFLVGTNSHHKLIEDEMGNIQFLNIQCMDVTGPYGDYEFVTKKGHWGPEIEMVTFEQLLEIYKEQIKLTCEREAKILKLMKDLREKCIKENGLDNGAAFKHSGGNLL